MVRQRWQVHVDELAGTARDTGGLEGGLARGGGRHRGGTGGVHECQGDVAAGCNLARLPEAGAGGRAVVTDEAEPAVGHGRTGHEAWAADDTGGHRRWYRGGVEGVGGEELVGHFARVDLAHFEAAVGIRGDEPAQARDAAHGGAQVLHLRQAGARQHDAGDDEEQHAEQCDLDERSQRRRTDHAPKGFREVEAGDVAKQPAHTEHRGNTDGGRTDGPQGRA